MSMLTWSKVYTLLVVDHRLRSGLYYTVVSWMPVITSMLTRSKVYTLLVVYNRLKSGLHNTDMSWTPVSVLTRSKVTQLYLQSLLILILTFFSRMWIYVFYGLSVSSTIFVFKCHEMPGRQRSLIKRKVIYINRFS